MVVFGTSSSETEIWWNALTKSTMENTVRLGHSAPGEGLATHGRHSSPCLGTIWLTIARRQCNTQFQHHTEFFFGHLKLLCSDTSRPECDGRACCYVDMVHNLMFCHLSCTYWYEYFEKPRQELTETGVTSVLYPEAPCEVATKPEV